MHDRYDNPTITELWGYQKQLEGWQRVEMAVMEARVMLGLMPPDDYQVIAQVLDQPPDIGWWKDEDKRVRHDLNAFIKERMRFIPLPLQHWFHMGMTSYDTEESAFVRKLLDSTAVCEQAISALLNAIRELALRYRFTPMMGVTHGQWADPLTFGKRVAGWYQDIRTSLTVLEPAKQLLTFSKLSGFVGNYTGITPETEKAALDLLGFKPYYGATQILPRSNFVPLGAALTNISSIVNNIALAIRLGARSASVLFQEPFLLEQMGSSAGPQKKNTIDTENTGGMNTLAQCLAHALQLRVETWEERAIEQSCVERVAWRDLFHALLRELTVMTRVLTGLVVYPDNMMAEIVKTNGCYAANPAKEVLKEIASDYGLGAEECYRVVQLAAFNMGYPHRDRNLPASLQEASSLHRQMSSRPLEPNTRGSIQEVIREGQLQHMNELSPTPDQVERWNKTLREIFSEEENRARWNKVFDLAHLLRHEHVIFEQVLGI